MRYWPPISGRARKRPPPSGKNNSASAMILHIGRVILVIIEVLVIFSLLLAFVFAAIVWVIGYPVSESDMTTVVGYIMPDSPAEKVGLQPGDKILEVDGRRVTRFLGMNDSVSWAVVRSEGETVPVKFERDGKVETVQVEPYKAETRGWRRKSVRQLLILPAETAIIDKVEPDTPAAAAGLRSRDIIRGFNHTPIYNPVALLEYIKKHPDETLALEVERSGSRFEVPVKPVPLPTDGKMQPRIGIQWDTSGQMSIAHPNPVQLDRKSTRLNSSHV